MTILPCYGQFCGGEMRNAYAIFVGRPEGKKALRKSRGKWKDNIIMDVRRVRRCRLDASG
jgi:hypothetical protein